MNHISTKFRVAVAMLMGVCFAASASATLITVPNSSFENPDVADGIFTDTTITPVPNWTFLGGDNGTITGGVWDPQNGDYTGTTGNNTPLPNQLAAAGGQTGYIYLEQTDDQNPQPLGAQFTTAAAIATIADKTRYTLTIALGRSKPLNHGDVTVELLVDDNSIASEFIEAGSLVMDTFENVTTSFDTGENDPLTGLDLKVRVRHSWGDAGFREIDFDNVRVETTVIPEPASFFALFAFGGLLKRRRSF